MSDYPIEFPPLLLREQSVSWRLGATTVSPGQGGSGGFAVNRFDGGGLWLADLNEVSLRTRAQVLLWRAVAALAENGVVPINVPMCEKRFFPAPVVNGKRVTATPAAVPHSDGMFFSDGTGYAGMPIVVAATVGDAALRATVLTLTWPTGGALQGGEKFSICHNGGQGDGWRLYEIKTAVLDGSGNYVISFRPPLRGPVAASTAVEFDNPRCLMHLARPDAMDLTLEQRRRALVSSAFQEYFWPVA